MAIFNRDFWAQFFFSSIQPWELYFSNRAKSTAWSIFPRLLWLVQYLTCKLWNCTSFGTNLEFVSQILSQLLGLCKNIWRSWFLSIWRIQPSSLVAKEEEELSSKCYIENGRCTIVNNCCGTIVVQLRYNHHHKCKFLSNPVSTVGKFYSI